MSPWFGKAIIIASSIVMVVIRAPHGQRSRGVKVVRSRRGRLEIVLLTLAWLSFFVPLLWAATPVFAFADYVLHPAPLLAGVVCLAADCGSSRSHAIWAPQSYHPGGPKSTSSSPGGIYRKKHPMYSALLPTRWPGLRGSELIVDRPTGPHVPRRPAWSRGAHDAKSWKGLRGVQGSDKRLSRRLVTYRVIRSSPVPPSSTVLSRAGPAHERQRPPALACPSSPP